MKYHTNCHANTLSVNGMTIEMDVEIESRFTKGKPSLSWDYPNDPDEVKIVSAHVKAISIEGATLVRTDGDSSQFDAFFKDLDNLALDVATEDELVSERAMKLGQTVEMERGE